MDRDMSVDTDDRASVTPMDPECRMGLHSWVDQVGRLPAETRCTRCGEGYGDPD